jgi:mitotic spindle assembly checkpoint protein MAD2
LAPGIFDVLAYTDAETAVPFTWVESDAKLIDNPQMVKLHSFDTKVTLRSFVLWMHWCAV